MSFEGADFGFVGGAYEAPMLLQDAQRLINWYPETDPSSNAKTPIALLGCPGLSAILSTITGPVRGAWALPGNTQCLFVVSSNVYVATVISPATQTSIPTFSIAGVGVLRTNSGPVCIRDNGVLQNGAGGYAVIVDGKYGYYYRISGASTITFTGTVTVGTPTITLPGTVNQYLVAGSVVSGTNIPLGTTILSIDFNANTITMSANATGSPGALTISVAAAQFGNIVDPGFLPADRIAFIEGWLIFNYTGTRTFFTTGPIAYTLSFPGAFFALKDSSTDNLITLFENNRELWLIGERTSEVWYEAGGAQFAFSRVPGVGPQMGCGAPHSIARIGDSLIWLGKNEAGENLVVKTNQYSWDIVSTHAISKAIGTYPLISDAIAYVYEEDAHIFYVLTFPTADVTWVLDLTVWTRTQGALGWHQRLSWDSVNGVYHRHRSNCFVNFADVRMVGDYQTGQIHQMSRSFYTDNGNILRCQRRTPHVWSRENRERVFQSALQIEFAPGVGLSTGQGSDPQCMLRWSNDGAQSWSNEHWTSIGKIGNSRNRAIWRRLGFARDRVFEANYSEPTPRDVVGATLFGEGTNMQDGG